nr:MAG TPA: hypothetical protein [Caudoviricetes sp.]
MPTRPGGAAHFSMRQFRFLSASIFTTRVLISHLNPPAAP